MSNQLVKKNPTEGYQNVFPKTWIDAIKDKESGVSLQEILQGFNMYFLSYNGSRALTRCKVPSVLRKEGLWITYVLYDHTVVTEWYNSDQIDDNSWSMDSNWRVASNNLVGDISVSSDGYWVINGEKTEAKAQGEQGVTPLLRVGANNKLQVSYNAGKAWKDISDYIVPKFRWNQGTDTSAGTIQISMDLGKTWTNLSNEITNNLRISRYIGTNESLPTSGVAEGTIYMKGPYYDEGDTSNANPIYRMWIYAWKGNTLAWQDNGEFTSISIGVVQERGNSTTEVMSQDAVTRELTELGQYVENSEWVKVVTDSEDKILYGVKTDGKFYFGDGCPPQVQEYVLAHIAEIETELATTKVDKVVGKSLIDADFASSQEVIENPEWLEVTTDSEGKVLEGINSNGEKEINVPLKKLNLTQDGMTTLINELEEQGISGGGVTQEELDQQLANYVQNDTLGAYETKQELNQTLEGYVKDTDNVSNIANGAVTVPALSQAVQDLISAGGSGTITNNPDDVTIETNSNNQLQIKEPYKIRGAQGPGGNASGNTRGIGATDFQLYRDNNSQVASAPYSFIAGGRGNKVADDLLTGRNANDGHAEGKLCQVTSWQGHAEGTCSICDSKIGHVEGNNCLCSSNDAHTEGNQGGCGRYYFRGGDLVPIQSGTEDAGDNLGSLLYILIPETYGDVTPYFPNSLFSAAEITAKYGAGYSKDEKGNVYPPGKTPAEWNGEALVDSHDLTWALHTFCYIRAWSTESFCRAEIKKSIYIEGVGTKVYVVPETTYSDYGGIYSSYSPIVTINDVTFGNGAHAEGIQGFAVGYGTHVEGYYCDSIGIGAHAEGYLAKTNGEAAHAEGKQTVSSGRNSHAEGLLTKSLSRASHSEGMNTIANGEASHAEGAATLANGTSSHAEGEGSVANGHKSHAEGYYTITSNRYEHAEGFYNKSNKASSTDGNAGNTLSSIGFGTEDNRKNAIEVMQNGDIYIYGIGGYDGTNANVSGVKTLQQVLLNQ